MQITLKAARINSGFSQKQVASELNVSNKTVSCWERGLSVPNIIQFKKLCSLYNVKDKNISLF